MGKDDISASLRNELRRRLSVDAHPRIALNDVFHRALLACCCLCVVKGIGATQKPRPSPNFQTLQFYSILHIADSHPYAYMKVSESFRLAISLETVQGQLGSPLVFALPG
jgi:Retinoblastoma-associated protein A domain